MQAHPVGVRVAADNGHSPTRILRAAFDLSRTRQALLSVVQPALGAILALGTLPTAHQMRLGLFASAAGFLAVFALNDVLDRRADSQAARLGAQDSEGFDLDVGFLRHPIAQGAISIVAAIAWVAALATSSAIAAWLLDPRCLALFGGAVVLETAYCCLRKTTWTKTFISGLMVGLGGLAGWVAVADLSMRAAPFFGFLALWEIAGRNLSNDLADLKADSTSGLTTVATVFGPKASAIAVLIGTGATLACLPLLPVSSGVAGLSVIASAALVAGPAVALLREPTSSRATRFFNSASFMPALVFLIVLLGVITS